MDVSSRANLFGIAIGPDLGTVVVLTAALDDNSCFGILCWGEANWLQITIVLVSQQISGLIIQFIIERERERERVWKRGK